MLGIRNAPVAQWIEHWASDPVVVGSSPAGRASIRSQNEASSRLLKKGFYGRETTW